MVNMYAQTELLAQVSNSTSSVFDVYSAVIRTEFTRIHWYLPTASTEVKIYHVDDATTVPTDKHVIAVVTSSDDCSSGILDFGFPGSGVTLKVGGRLLAQQVTTTNDVNLSAYGATEDEYRTSQPFLDN